MTPLHSPAVLFRIDGNGLVDRRDLATGKICSSCDLPGAVDIVVDKGKVLVFRSAVYDAPEVQPTVVLLDLLTGRELLRKAAPHRTPLFFGVL